MMESDTYGLALLALGACGLLIYVVHQWPARSVSRTRRHRFHHPVLRFEQKLPFEQKQFAQELPIKQKLLFDITDVGQQLHAVMGASFERRRLLNRSEYEAFKIIEAEITAARRGFRVFAQTCLGEVLASPDENAFRSINGKRVDFLVVDRGGWPVVAIEYQGAAHYQGTAAARDAVKKEALRKAGVRYVEILQDDTEEQIRSRVREQLGWRPRPVLNEAAE